MRKIAVVFPGIGYHTDKPLLYYSKKIASSFQYEIVEVPYGNFEEGVKGYPEKMLRAFEIAQMQCEEMLKEVPFENYDKILFLSKSIGTAAASMYAKKHHLQTFNVFYTPVQASMELMEQPGIVFHGTDDSWIETTDLIEKCQKKQYPYHLIEGGNHSLETGDVLVDIRNMECIMKETRQYIKRITELPVENRKKNTKSVEQKEKNMDNLFLRLEKSKFRSSFSLKEKDVAYVKEKGMDTIRSHATDFVQKRLAPAIIPNDGKQTPMKGHPAFIAQHATATCCRGCLKKWHHIPSEAPLTIEQQEYVVSVIMEWIQRQIRK